MVVELAVTSIAIYGFLLKQERSSLLEKEPVHGDGGNGQLDNKQPPSPKSLRALSFTQNIREVANPEIESAEASTSISLNTSPARPHVDNVKSDREANSTSTNTSSTNAITKPHSENGNAFATTTTKDAALGIYNSEVISNRSTEQTPTNNPVCQNFCENNKESPTIPSTWNKPSVTPTGRPLLSHRLQIPSAVLRNALAEMTAAILGQQGLQDRL